MHQFKRVFTHNKLSLLTKPLDEPILGHRENMKEENEANLEWFLQWAAALGISDSPISNSYCLGRTLCVAIFPEAGGRGLAAARAIKQGELVLRVPKAALMTSDCLINKDRHFSAALGKYRFLSSTQILSIALLNEVNKGCKSWWYPYIKQLPQSYNLLASFGRFEVEALQIDDAIWIAEKGVQTAKTEWKEATPLMSELNMKPQLITFKAWLWASATISSRTMHVPWDNAGCLCPVGDFFNYAPPQEEEPYHLESSETSSCEEQLRNFDVNADRLTDARYDEEAASYCFYSKRNYIEGDQVLLSYGTYTNLELLDHYGFVLQGNPNDKVFISLEPEMYSLCSWPKESLHISQDGKPSFALLSTVRLWATPVSKRKSIGHFAYSGNQISADNEISVMEWIGKKCGVLLRSYSTSIEEDELLLRIIEKNQDFGHVCSEYGELSPVLSREICAFLERKRVMNGEVSGKRCIDRLKLAVEWRYGYKRILCDCISYCDKILHNFA